MNDIEKQKLLSLLIRLKRVNSVYPKSTEDQKGLLLERIEPTIQELIGLGYNREFLIGLIIGGKDFLESFGPVDLEDSQLGELIFK